MTAIKLKVYFEIKISSYLYILDMKRSSTAPNSSKSEENGDFMHTTLMLAVDEKKNCHICKWHNK